MTFKAKHSCGMVYEICGVQQRMEPVNEPFGNTERLAAIRTKVNEILEDDSEGAVGKKYDFDHHVKLRHKMNELLEEDVPYLLDIIQSIQQEREPVRWFAGRMESRLLENDHKGGWGQENCSMDYLAEQMDRKCRRYVGLNGSGDTPEGLIDRLADIANYAMMQADRLRHMKSE